MGCQAALIRPQVVSTDLNSYDLLAHNFANGLRIDGDKLFISPTPGCGMKFEDAELARYRIRSE
jgi:hypothetical protein